MLRGAFAMLSRGALLFAGALRAGDDRPVHGGTDIGQRYVNGQANRMLGGD